MCMSRCGCSNSNSCSNNNSGCSCSNNMATMNATLFNGTTNNNVVSSNSMIAQNGIGVNNLMYGHAYVPNQTFSTIFSAEQGLNNGTMFPELVSVYVPNQSLATMNFLRNNNMGGCCR